MTVTAPVPARAGLAPLQRRVSLWQHALDDVPSGCRCTLPDSAEPRARSWCASHGCLVLTVLKIRVGMNLSRIPTGHLPDCRIPDLVAALAAVFDPFPGGVVPVADTARVAHLLQEVVRSPPPP